MTHGRLTDGQYIPEEDPKALARRKRLATKLRREMKRRKMTINRLSTTMETHRRWVYRLLDPLDLKVTVGMVWRAEQALGIKLLD
jgi:hypothetical protein